MTSPARKRKLIEVALPLDDINAACKADKDRKTGTIRNLHKWFAPMPLPAWRALLFAALIDDPEDDVKRAYLLDTIKRLVANGADLPDEATVNEAQRIIKGQFGESMPTVIDPFCGAGSTLVEAQRLGLPTFASDLNPVPVLITRTLTEVLPSVYGQQPIHPLGVTNTGSSSPDRSDQLFDNERRFFRGYEGLSNDVEYYAAAIEQTARDRLKTHFWAEPGEIPIAWLWARTVRCPNPTCGIETILTSSWWMSKNAKHMAWLEPSVSGNEVHLKAVEAASGAGAPTSLKIGDGVFACLSCSATLDSKYLRQEGAARRLGVRMTAVVSERGKRRHYRASTQNDIASANSVQPDTTLAEIPIDPHGQGIRVGKYGIETWDQLYTPRQLVTMSTFADLVSDTYDRVIADGGTAEWATAVTTLLGLAVGKMAQYGSSQAMIVPYPTSTTRFNSGFARNDLPMTWDFYEANFFGNVGGTWSQLVKTVLASVSYAPFGEGVAVRADARTVSSPQRGLVATDPPYFDAIGYSDLADYFYIWHRRALRRVHPDLYTTVAVPKAGELTAIASRHGNSASDARAYFIEGFTEAFKNLQREATSDLPMLVVYASKEQKGGRDEETRWSSILTAMIQADLEITGSWPIHGTGSTRLRGISSNAVATYIVMVCRPRTSDATMSLADFNRALRRELGGAVRDLQAASILPVDLNQAAMGPAMQIYSRYRAVLDQSGDRVPVQHALRLINSALAEVLDEQEGELDAASRFAVRWWDTRGWLPAPFGEADKAARPLGISVDDVVHSKVAENAGQKVRLLGAESLDPTWTPSTDAYPTAWEAVHHLANRLIDRGGELEAARLMAALANLHDPAMALVYRLHDIAAKKGRTSDQERYNALINSWSELVKLSKDAAPTLEGWF